MRLCASLFQGVAAPLGCVIFFRFCRNYGFHTLCSGLSACARHRRYHYPRRALRASETLDSRLSKRLTADKRMQKALEEYLYLLYGDKAPNPVLTPDEEELRRMDIFACAARNTEDANGSAIQENLVVELKAPKVVLTKAVLRQIEDYMDYVRKQPLFNSQYRRWKFIAVCSAVDDDVKARYDSQKSKGKKGLVAEIDNYEVYALTWDDVFQSFDLRHAFLLDKLKMDKEAIAAEIAQTAGDEKSKDTADALTALVAN